MIGRVGLMMSTLCSVERRYLFLNYDKQQVVYDRSIIANILKLGW